VTFLCRIFPAFEHDTISLGTTDSEGLIAVSPKVRRLWILAPGQKWMPVILSTGASEVQGARVVRLSAGGALHVSVRGWREDAGLSAYFVVGGHAERVKLGQDGTAAIEGLPVGSAEFVIRRGYYWKHLLDGPPALARVNVHITQGSTSYISVDVDSNPRDGCQAHLRVSEGAQPSLEVRQVVLRGVDAENETVLRELQPGPDFARGGTVQVNVPIGRYRLTLHLDRYSIQKLIRLEQDQSEIGLQLPSAIPIDVTVITPPGERVPSDATVLWEVKAAPGGWEASGGSTAESGSRTIRFYVPEGDCSLAVVASGYLRKELALGSLRDTDRPNLEMRVERAATITLQLFRDGKRVSGDPVWVGLEPSGTDATSREPSSVETVADGKDIELNDLCPGVYTLRVTVGDSDSVEVKGIAVVQGQRKEVRVEVK
jgi:hypothetical protein